jgi:hypothetical protein
VTERRYGSYFSEGRKPERRSRTFFSPAIDETRLGVSCYPTALLSFKLAYRPLKFQRVTANNSSYFVQFLKKKIPPPLDRILGYSMRSGTYFFFFLQK